MRFLFIIFSLFAFANAQYYNVDLNNGIVEFTDTTSSFIKYSFTAQEISYREVGVNNFDICDNAFCNGFSMKQIANFTNRSYLLDSLNYWQSISASSFSGLWQTTNGYYEPKTSKPFNFTYQGYSLLNDSLDLGFAKLPFVGVKGSTIDSLVGLNGFLDASAFGEGDILISGWTSFGGDKENAIYVFDTSGIQMVSNNSSLGLYPYGFDVGQYKDTTQSQISIDYDGSINLRFDDYNKFFDYNISMGTDGMFLNYNDYNIGLTQNFNSNENGIGVYYKKQDTITNGFYNKDGITFQYLDSFDIQVNNSGLVLPRVANTIGFIPGSIYYDSDDKEFKAMTQFTKRTISLYYEGFGNPTGIVTPDQPGVLYHDQGTNHVYISFGTTSADWIKLN